MCIPALYLPAGAMLRGHWRGRTLGSGTDVFKLHAERRAGNLSDEDWHSPESGFARSAGTCMVMGTASTMMSLAEPLGMTLPGAPSIPAVDATHAQLAVRAGMLIVDIVVEDLPPAQLLTREAFDNATP